MSAFQETESLFFVSVGMDITFKVMAKPVVSVYGIYGSTQHLNLIGYFRLLNHVMQQPPLTSEQIHSPSTHHPAVKPPRTVQ